MTRMNQIKPAPKSKFARKRVGRGQGSGLGKTCGKGHKGQKSRSGGYHKVGFEGGQMPIQRRLPKVGFNSHIKRVTDEVRLHELEKIGDVGVIDKRVLQQKGLITSRIRNVKIILSGKLTKAIHIKGIAVTKGAKSAIEAVGGTVE